MAPGLLILNKPEGMTSQMAVNRTKRLFGESKAGHTGTLDPMATGVLPVLLGRAVKASEFLLCSDKYYAATLRLGLTTDTEDISGTVLSTSDRIPTEEEVRAAAESLRGESEQIPPMYSAIKIGGKKLCDLARAGVEIDRAPRKIIVYDLQLTRLTDRDYRLDVHCSKGTYIRTLCADIGKKLGTGAVMASLCRTKTSRYSLADAVTPEELERMTEEERLALLHPVEEIFRDFENLTLPNFFSRLCRNGQAVLLSKLGVRAPVGTRFALYDATGFFGVGEVIETDGAPALKAIRQF